MRNWHYGILSQIMAYANSKGPDQTAHLHSLIRAFLSSCRNDGYCGMHQWTEQPLTRLHQGSYQCRLILAFALCIQYILFTLTHVMLNKLRCHTHFQFSANQITWSRLFLYSNTEWQTVQIQISICKSRAYPGSAGQGLSIRTDRPEQPVQTQSRCHIVQHQIRVYTVCTHLAIFRHTIIQWNGR